MLDGLQEILFTLRQNKLRTLLTAFGVFWGIFMLIMLLGFGRGMQNGVLNDFGSDVLDSILIWSGDTSVAYRGRGLARHIQFEQADIEAIKNQIPGVRVISGESSRGNGTVTFGRKSASADIHGIPDEYFRVKEDVPFPIGRKPNRLDVEEVRKVVVIGTVVAERLVGPGGGPGGHVGRIDSHLM